MGIHGSWHLRGLVTGILLVFAAIPARADFTNLMETGGGAMVMSEKETTVRMASETVNIILGEKDYAVQATFEFVNDGPAVTLPVGFPRERYGINSRLAGASDFISFTGSVDGKPITFTERIGPLKIRTYLDRAETEFTITDAVRIEHILSELRNGNQQIDLGVEYTGFSLWETRWYVKDMTFKARGTTVVTAEYRDKYTVGPSTHYIYGTGRAWKGPIGKATFVVKASPAVWAIDRARFIISPESRERRSYRLERVDEYTHQYILTDLEPAEDEVMDVFIGPPSQPWGDYGFERIQEKELPADFPAILSYGKMLLMREAIYANHGKLFDNPILTSFFSLTTAYRLQKNYSDVSISAIEKKNLALLNVAIDQLPANATPLLSDTSIIIDGLICFFAQTSSPFEMSQITLLKTTCGAGGIRELRQIYSVLSPAQKKAIVDTIDRRISIKRSQLDSQASQRVLTTDQRLRLLDYDSKSTTPWGAILRDDQWAALIRSWDTLDEATRAKVKKAF